MFNYYEPTKNEKRMENSTDLPKARIDFLSRKNKILYNCVKKRYIWMNEYIPKEATSIYELGCGIGVSKEFINNPNLILTDILDNVWVDKKVDALNMDFEEGSVDIIICCNVIHHFAKPYKFIEEAAKKLHSGGKILIFEPYTSLFLKLAQRILRLEGWNDKVNVFNPNIICNNPDEPWSANNSIPKILFSDKMQFEYTFPNLKIEKYELTECLAFLLSGGVNFHCWHPNFGEGGCNILNRIDEILIKICPSMFALGCKVVIRKE